MPFGIVILAILLIVLAFGFGKTIQKAFLLSQVGSMLFICAVLLSYLIYPAYSPTAEIYPAPALLCAALSLYLLLKSTTPVRTFFSIITCIVLLAIISFFLPNEPEGYLQPIYIYGAVSGLILLVLCAETSDALCACIASLLLLNGFLVVRHPYTDFMSFSMLTSICISGLISTLPRVLFKRRLKLITHRQKLDFELSSPIVIEEKQPPKNKINTKM